MQCTLVIEETAFASSTSECVIQLYTLNSNSDSQESPAGIITVLLKAYHCSRSQEAAGNGTGQDSLTVSLFFFIAKGEMLMRKQWSLWCSDEKGDGQSSLSTWFYLKSTKRFSVFDDMRAFPGRLKEDRSPTLNVNANILWCGVSPTYKKKSDRWAQNFISFFFLPPDPMRPWPHVSASMNTFPLVCKPKWTSPSLKKFCQIVCHNSDKSNSYVGCLETPRHYW